MSVHDLYLRKRTPYTSPVRSTTATEFIPDPILSKKQEFVPMIIKQIGKRSNSL
jgi:hypothetical protein